MGQRPLLFGGGEDVLRGFAGSSLFLRLQGTRDGFMPAPYMARARWVKVNTPGKLLRKEWQDLVRDSYEMIKAKLTKKARMELGLQ